MSEYVRHIEELFSGLGVVEAKRMFGGHGLYVDGTMFALIVDDRLYLKADRENQADFLAQSLPPFQYQKGSKAVQVSYYLAPDDILDDSEIAKTWGQRSLAAARRSQRLKT